MELKSIDINCDLGESFGRFRIGNDMKMMEFISSCNIACGFHGGDPLTIEEAIGRALEKDVAIGAHVSYPDLSGFGRRSISMEPDELYSLISYQIAALSGMVKMQSGRLHHLKLHGALYNDANHSPEISTVIIDVLKDWPEKLWLYCPDGTLLARTARSEDIQVCKEAFVDRRYEQSGVLAARTQKGAVISEHDEGIQQLLSIVQDRRVPTIDGTTIPLQADTICLHGDHSNSVGLAQKIDEALGMKGIPKKYAPYL